MPQLPHPCTHARANVQNFKWDGAMHGVLLQEKRHFGDVIFMEHGSTLCVGLTLKKHGRHTLVQILFSSEN